MKNTSPRDIATDSLKHLGNRVTDLGEKVSEFVVENTEAARERVAEAYDAAKKQVATGVKTTRVAVRQHPLESVAAAFSVGLIVGILSGFLFGRRR